MKKMAVLLHNIRSAHNVGSIFRTCDAAGVEKIFLSGYTPIPVDRFGRAESAIQKVALGAEKTIKWEYHKNPYTIVASERAAGSQIVAIEQDRGAVDYRTFRVKQPTLFILGNEVRGVSKAMLKKCDTVLEIPMHGKKESLNVSVAAGIVLFALQ